jgi:hypothetical protein
MLGRTICATWQRRFREGILARLHGINKPDDKAIRERAMGRRVPMEAIASAIIAADWCDYIQTMPGRTLTIKERGLP